MDFGPSLWTLNGFGLPPFFIENPHVFSRFQSFVQFWALVQHCDFLNLNNTLECISYLEELTII